MALRLSFASDSMPSLWRSSRTPGRACSSNVRRLVLANDSARRLLGSTRAPDDFLEALRVSIGNGVIEEGLFLHARGGVYEPVLYPARSRSNHSTRLCFLVRRSEATCAYKTLSRREAGVLILIVKGHTNGEIAEELGISIETVRKHVAHALEKTGAKTRAGLVGRALGALRT